jgi:hypothetical protein
MRQRSPSGPSSASALIASSKSRAVVGSMVKVGRSRRSRRPSAPGSRSSTRSTASVAARSTPGGKERRSPRSSISASSTSRATSGRPMTLTTLGWPLTRPPARTSTSCPGRPLRPGSTTNWPPPPPRRGAKNGSQTTKRPRLASTPTTNASPCSGRPPRGCRPCPPPAPPSRPRSPPRRPPRSARRALIAPRPARPAPCRVPRPCWWSWGRPGRRRQASARCRCRCPCRRGCGPTAGSTGRR